MKLAVIGMGGRMSHLVTNQFFKLLPKTRLVGVIDPNEKTVREKFPAEALASTTFCKTVSELVKKTKPDAIAIGTRCNLHATYAIEVLKLGIPLYLEKPVAVSMKQAMDLEMAMEKSRVETVVSFPLRLSPLSMHARHLIEKGAIGEPEHVLGVNYVSYGSVYFDSWYRDYKTTQGLFVQKATHDLDYLMYLAGSPIVRVAAMISRGRVYKDSSLKKGKRDQSALFYDNIGTPATGMNEDSSSTLLEFANGAQGLYTQVFFSRRDAAVRGATISGRLGTISFDWYKSQVKYVRHYEPLTDVSTLEAGVDHFGGDQVLVQNFIDVVTHGAKSLSPLSAGLESVYACLAARQSALGGRFQNVRQIGAEK